MAKTTLAVNTGTPSYVKTLTTALQRGLRGAQVMPERVRRNRFRFEVVWGKFDSMGHPERQRLVWDIAEKSLDKPDLLNVAMIITLGKSDLPSN